jgi:mannosyltransferase OCH1-like enzyme
MTNKSQIPKSIHVVWVGNQSKCPHQLIDTWVKKNPSWNLRLWGNDDLTPGNRWTNHQHIQAMFGLNRFWGVADMMRYEILYRHGGVTIDADSICLRGLDDWLCDLEAFACWENELVRPGLIACGIMGASRSNPFFRQIIDDICAEQTVIDKHSWQSVGPQRLTNSYYKYKYSNLTILPSHMFMPVHYTGVRYTGSGLVFATQIWATARKINAQLNQINPADFESSV